MTGAVTKTPADHNLIMQHIKKMTKWKQPNIQKNTANKHKKHSMDTVVTVVSEL